MTPKMTIKEYFAAETEALRAKSQGMTIKLGIIDGTDKADSANQLYIKNKLKDFANIGWEAKVYPVLMLTSYQTMLGPFRNLSQMKKSHSQFRRLLMKVAPQSLFSYHFVKA